MALKGKEYRKALKKWASERRGIHAMLDRGVSQTEVARRRGLSRQRVQQIARMPRRPA